MPNRPGRPAPASITENYDQIVAELIATRNIRGIARKFGAPVSTVWTIAKRLGLSKTAEEVEWSAEEVECLRHNKVPPKRTKNAAHAKAKLLGIPFHPINSRSGRHQTERISMYRNMIEEELRATGKIRATARMFSMSYSAVWYIARDIGLTKEAA